MDKFDGEIAKVVRKLIAEAADFRESELADLATAEATSMGNFHDPLTGQNYGYKFTVGDMNFFKGDEA